MEARNKYKEKTQKAKSETRRTIHERRYGPWAMATVKATAALIIRI